MTGLLLGLWLAYHSLRWKENEWSGERKIPSLPWREWWCTFPAAVIISPPLAVAVRHHYAPIEFYSAISRLLLPLSLAQDDRVAPTPGEQVAGVCHPIQLPSTPPTHLTQCPSKWGHYTAEMFGCTYIPFSWEYRNFFISHGFAVTKLNNFYCFCSNLYYMHTYIYNEQLVI